MQKVENLILKKGKAFNKTYIIKHQNYFIDLIYFNKLLLFFNVSFKIKKWFCRRLFKKNLMLNYRLLYRYYIMKNFNPLKKVFYRYNSYLLISQDNYSITDFQLELIRRLARKIFGKHVYIKLLIFIERMLLRRTNQSRMGGGKGSKFYKKIYSLYKGCPILEIRHVLMKRMLLFNLYLKKKLGFCYCLVSLNRF